MTKVALRQQFLAQRKALDTTTLQSKSQAITDRFLHHFNLTEITSLHLFLPILRQNEINTYLISKAIWHHYPHITVITSKSDFKTGEMQQYILKSTTRLVENKWHIPEPVDAEPFLGKSISMVLLPLLCFDQRGFRVGYGKGFYDRFLARYQMESNCLQRAQATEIVKVGLSLFPPVEKIIDIQLFDIKMNFCISDDTIWTF